MPKSLIIKHHHRGGWNTNSRLDGLSLNPFSASCSLLFLGQGFISQRLPTPNIVLSAVTKIQTNKAEIPCLKGEGASRCEQAQGLEVRNHLWDLPFLMFARCSQSSVGGNVLL